MQCSEVPLEDVMTKEQADRLSGKAGVGWVRLWQC